ncbi:hypothetical protein [Nocardia abscessus]|uniref:hypothetical protein n=1 Tax=Nocardia abscessus TaxID=120957 RepID=UPI003CC7E15C
MHEPGGVGRSDRGGDVIGQRERDLGLYPGLQQSGDIHRGIGRAVEIIEQDAEVRLVHAELPLHVQ